MTSPAELVALVCCDLGAIVRGRSLLEPELQAQAATGVGWVPANQALTPLGGLAEPNPFDSVGDLRLVPDLQTHVRVAADDGSCALQFVMCDIVETDGRPWAACPRTFLRDALDELQQGFGLGVVASFEHEFQLIREQAPPLPFSLAAQRQAEPFAGHVMGALVEAGAAPERFFAEFAPHQYEIPVEPARGVHGADRAVTVTEIVRDVARAHGMRASFAPLLDLEGPGNGVHIHISLVDSHGHGVMHDPTRPGGLSEVGGRFAAGVLRHAAALSALTAASPVSAARLTPHRWSAGAVCLAERNREALLRIPGTITLDGGDGASQVRLEYRGADASANPYLALGAIVRAGLDGLTAQLEPPPVLDRDPSQLAGEEAERFGVQALPGSLEASIAALEGDSTARGWMPHLLFDAYTSVKRAEIAAADGVELSEVCRRYGAIY